MIRYCLPIVFAVLATAGASQGHAQRVPHYARTPTISPYANLFRGNTGGINNYFSFVRPVQRQLQFNQDQTVRNRRVEQEILLNQQALPGQIMDAQRQLLRRGILRQGKTAVGQPAVAASYFNYSHYYGQPVTGATGAGLRVGRR